MNDQLERMEISIAKFLRAGVIFVAIVLFIGWLLELWQGQGSFERYRVYQHSSFIQKWSEEQISAADAIIDLGLLCLILLPLLRVLLTFFIFLKRRDHLLAVAAGFVTMVLILSFTLGFEL